MSKLEVQRSFTEPKVFSHLWFDNFIFSDWVSTGTFTLPIAHHVCQCHRYAVKCGKFHIACTESSLRVIGNLDVSTREDSTCFAIRSQSPQTTRHPATQHLRIFEVVPLSSGPSSARASASLLCSLARTHCGICSSVDKPDVCKANFTWDRCSTTRENLTRLPNANATTSRETSSTQYALLK